MSSREPFHRLNDQTAAPSAAANEEAGTGIEAGRPDGMGWIATPEGGVFCLEHALAVLPPASARSAGMRYAPELLRTLIGVLEPEESLCWRLGFAPQSPAAAVGFSIRAVATDVAACQRRGGELADLLGTVLGAALPDLETVACDPADRVALIHRRELVAEGIALPLGPDRAAVDRPGPRLVVVGGKAVAAEETIILPSTPQGVEQLAMAVELLGDSGFAVEVEVKVRRVKFDAATMRQLYAARARLADRSLDQFLEKAKLPFEEVGANAYLTGLMREGEGCEVTIDVRSEQPLGEALIAMLSLALFGAPAARGPADAAIDLRGLYPSETFFAGVLPVLLGLVPAGLMQPKPDRQLPTSGLRIGRAARGVDLRLREPDRTQHTYMIGATGTGKSTLILNMIRQDMADGKGVILFDPHGDLWREVRSSVPKERESDVVLVHLGDRSLPFTMNILAGQGGDARVERHTITNSLIEVFRRVLYQGTPEAFGPAFEAYFRNALMLLMEAEGDNATILDFERVFDSRRLTPEELHNPGRKTADSDDEDDNDDPFASLRASSGSASSSGRRMTFRESLLERCPNEHVKGFWSMAEDVNGEWTLANMAPYICVKLTQITGSPLLAPVLGARTSTLDFGQIIREGKICLINLAKGHVGAKDAAFAGGLMSVRLAMAALAQARVPEAERRFVSVYLDEFQTYATDLLADAMAEVRKYRIALVLANQTLSQIDGQRDRADAMGGILGNAANLIAFRVGVPDAELLARWFAPHFSALDLAQLPNYTAVARLLADGKPLPPLRFATLAPGGA